MIAKAYSFALLGLEAIPIRVEVDISGGLPDLVMVGLPDTAVRESRERVRAAIQSAGFYWPVRRLLVNLAPAHIRKEGSGYDLAVAAGILKASGQLESVDLDDYVFAGELSIDGSVRPVRGILAMAASMAAMPHKAFAVSEENVGEALQVTDRVVPLRHLSQTAALRELCQQSAGRQTKWILPTADDDFHDLKADLVQVAGQNQARRALEIAAAGRHNILMTGPPGSGKSLLARCLPSLLPPLSEEEVLSVNRIYSAAGLLNKEKPWIRQRPFRCPHVNLTKTGMIGGGVPFQPGEISLAHCGILYVDEISEMSRPVLESLRQPAEERKITISKSWGTMELPADFQLIGTANPCYCGYSGDRRIACRCTAFEIKRYQNKISGPLMDRIDLRISVPRVEFDSLQFREVTPETSKQVRQRVDQAWQIRREREKKGSWDMQQLQRCLTPAAKDFLARVYDHRGMTARGYGHVLRLARTIGDLEGQEAITAEILAEAVQYRG